MRGSKISFCLCERVRRKTVLLGVVMLPFKDSPLANAIAAGWISIEYLWMFGGFLAMSKKEEEQEKNNER